MYNLGVAAYNGQGTEENQYRAARLFTAAAEKGHVKVHPFHFVIDFCCSLLNQIIHLLTTFIFAFFRQLQISV